MPSKNTEHHQDPFYLVNKGLMQNALMSARNGIVIADATRHDMPLIFVNQAFVDITGYTASEAVGTNCRFLQGNQTDQPGLTTLRDAIRDGGSCRVILKNKRKNGKSFWNELYIAPIRNSKGKLTHYIGIQNDVTRQIEAEASMKKLQKKLRAGNRELKALNEQKNELLGMAAHDIRNPLTTIGLNVAMLKSILKSPEPKKHKARHILERIGEASSFMLQMVNDLLDVSKIESGKMTLSLEPCTIHDILHERLPMYRQQANAKQITITCNRCNALPAVHADKDRILQVIDNLVSNALKFSHAESKVKLRAYQVGEAVTVEVIDRGQGIPEEERDKLFKTFSKTSVRSTAGEASTGLGLAICRKIVEAHGGTITVDSEIDKGSTFKFSLPIQPCYC